MRVTLVHNPAAGGGEHAGVDLQRALASRGDEVRVATVDAALGAALEEGSDLIVVAGGDGTVGRLVREVVRHAIATPVLVVPAGTANNVARSLGIGRRELNLARAAARWERRWVDVAVVDEHIVIEGAGCGALAGFMRAESDEQRDGVRREKKTFADRLESSPCFDYRVSIDGEEVAGEALLIEALVMPQLGPNVVLAPDADPSDGILDLVILHERDREGVVRALRRRRRLPELDRRRAASLTIACDAPWHFDDAPVGRRTRSIAVRPRAWQALVPPVR